LSFSTLRPFPALAANLAMVRCQAAMDFSAPPAPDSPECVKPHRLEPAKGENLLAHAVDDGIGIGEAQEEAGRIHRHQQVR
jgi:hypothetical protein